MVVKSDGRREPWNHGKLMAGLRKACEKRPIPANALEEVAEAVETRLHQSEEREVGSREVGAMVMDALRQLDPVAYVRFASVYRRFEDVGAFVEEVRSLLHDKSAFDPEP